jgi:D-glycero-alpha-D-manno-heptose-7-phosphate kinase
LIIRAKAPVRISLAGGGTDVSPYIEEKGGIVINATINKYAYVTLVPRNDTKVKITSLDYKNGFELDLGDELVYDGNLDLVKAAIKVLGIKRGCDIVMHSDAAPGTGLGSSSTLTTAVIGTIDRWLRLALNHYELAELAYKIEREEAGIKGGKQDQFATVFGGVNYIEFHADRTVVNQLRIRPEVLDELEYRLILCDTRRSRVAAVIIEEQVKSYANGNQDVVRALDATRELAIRMKEALVMGKIDEIGHLLDEGWRVKKKFSSKITDPEIDEIYEYGRSNGAIGGKLLGAGGGGHMLFLCNGDKRCLAAEKLRDRIVPFAFESRGLHTWKVE